MMIQGGITHGKGSYPVVNADIALIQGRKEIAEAAAAKMERCSSRPRSRTGSTSCSSISSA